MDLWDWSLQATSDTEMKARLQGVKAVMSTSQFLFSCSLGKIIFKQADNLNKTLQYPSISAAQGQEIAHLEIETLRKDRCDEKFELFWSNLMNKETELVVADPKLPRKRKLTDSCCSQSSNDTFYHDHPKKIYRQLYFETLDNIINCIKNHFNQTDYQTYAHLQEILIKAFKEQDWEDDFQIVIQNYGANEFDVPSLKTQLLLLPEIAKFYGLNSRMKLLKMIALFQKLDTILREC